MRAAIAIDKWKLSIFKKVLDGGGFVYTKGPGVTSDTWFLYVETDTIEKLQPFVVTANNTALHSRNKNLN